MAINTSIYNTPEALEDGLDEPDDISDELRDIFCRYKDQQKASMFESLNSVRCCDCGHKARIQTVQEKIFWYKKMSTFYQYILALLPLCLIMIAFTLWSARRYNKARSLGSGACLSTFFWTYDDCEILF